MSATLSATLWTRPNGDPVEQFAAAELQRYLSRMLALAVERRPAPKWPGLPGVPSLYLAIGADTPPASLPAAAAGPSPDSYVLRGSQDGVLLQAPTPRGLLYAAYGLLRHLGARWFFPGPEGEHVPRVRSVSLAGLEVTAAPAIAQRGVLLRGSSPYLEHWVDFAPKIGLSAIGLETHEGVHRLPGLAAGRGLHLRLRRRFFPTIFCSQDERTLRWEETLLQGYLQSLPAGFDSVHLRPADTFGARCTCPADAPYSLADQVMRFTNRMAEGARRVGVADYPYVAYQSTWGPPPQVPPGPGVSLSLAPIHRCFNHAVADSTCWINATDGYERPLGRFEYGLRPVIEAHLQRFDPARTSVVDYWVDASIFGRGRLRHWGCRLPNNGRIVQQDIQYYRGIGIPSIWTFAVSIDDEYLARFTSPLIFQYGALLWDPDTDLRAGLRDFCRHWYGDEALAAVFPLDECSDPRDVLPQVWGAQIERVSRALRATREVAAGAHEDVIRARLNRLIAEHEHRIAAMQRYQEGPLTI